VQLAGQSGRSEAVTKRRRRLLGLLALAALAGVLAVPAVHWRLIGWWRGEPFWQGRPASYYASHISAHWRAVSPTEIWVRDHLPSGVREVVWGDHREIVEGMGSSMKPGNAAGLEALPVLIALAENLDAEVRWQVTIWLKNLNEDATPAVPVLTRLLDDPVPAVRFNAAEALGLIGEASRPAVPKLRALLSDNTSHHPTLAVGTVGEAAAFALRKIDPAAWEAAGRP
jgi:hypothetical protein